MDNYYVYACYVNDEVKYIGMGKKQRSNHCISGKSSCLELNKAYFLKMKMETVIIFDNLTREEALSRETLIINEIGIDNLYNKISGNTPNKMQEYIKAANKVNAKLENRAIALVYETYSAINKLEYICKKDLETLCIKLNEQYKKPIYGYRQKQFMKKLMAMFGFQLMTGGIFKKVSEVDIEDLVSDISTKMTKTSLF